MRKTPTIYAQGLHALLVSTGREMRPSAIRSFLAELARTRRSHLKPRILAEFRRIALAAEGRRAGRILTAAPLEHGLRSKIEKRFGDVAFEETVDQKIKGGAVIEIEDTRYDGSVAARLDELKKTLIRNS